MQKNWRVTICALMLCSGVATVALTQSLAPQSSTPSQPSAPRVTMTPPTTSGSYAATLTGCVERADQLAIAESASPSADKDASFLLTHSVRNTTDVLAVPVGTSGTVPGDAGETTFKLDAAVATLNPFVGHQVEVTGSVTVLMGGSAAPAANSAVADLGAGHPRMKVDKIRTIAETCGR